MATFALRKLERSSRAPAGCRLVSVQEAKDNLEWIKQSNNLLEEWDRARLLDGWIGGSAYDFKVEQGFGSCLGYMLVIESPSPEISDHADDRKAVVHSNFPELSEGGRSAALLLCSEDWNEEVLYWFLAGEGIIEEDRSRVQNTMSLLEGDGPKLASEVVSAVARGFQSVRGKSMVPATESSLTTLAAMNLGIHKYLENYAFETQETWKAWKAFEVESKRSVEALINKNQYSEKGKIANEILETELFSKIPEIIKFVFDETNLLKQLEDLKNFGFDTSVPSTRETVVHTVSYFVAEASACALLFDVCKEIYYQVVTCSSPSRAERETMDDCSAIASLISYVRQFLWEKCSGSDSGSDTDSTNFLDRTVRAAAREANGDCKRFDEILRGQASLILSCEDNYDVLSAFLLRAAKEGDASVVRMMIKNHAQLSAKEKSSGLTALHYAAGIDRYGSYEIATMLL